MWEGLKLVRKASLFKHREDSFCVLCFRYANIISLWTVGSRGILICSTANTSRDCIAAWGSGPRCFPLPVTQGARQLWMSRTALGPSPLGLNFPDLALRHRLPWVERVQMWQALLWRAAVWQRGGEPQEGWINRIWILTLTSLVRSFMNLGRRFLLSKPQFPPLQHRDVNTHKCTKFVKVKHAGMCRISSIRPDSH